MRVLRHRHDWRLVRHGGEWGENSYYGCTRCRKTKWVDSHRQVTYSKRSKHGSEVFPWEQETET